MKNESETIERASCAMAPPWTPFLPGHRKRPVIRRSGCWSARSSDPFPGLVDAGLPAEAEADTPALPHAEPVCTKPRVPQMGR